jgi:hypothetical protein
MVARPLATASALVTIVVFVMACAISYYTTPVALGAIPESAFDSDRVAHYHAYPWEVPRVSEAAAIQTALREGQSFVSPVRVRRTYLVVSVYRLQIRRADLGRRYLEWIVDLSPNCPFPAISGGPPGVRSAPASPPPQVPGCPVVTYQMTRSLWVEVDAASGASVLGYGG